jgi:hypothetical protein
VTPSINRSHIKEVATALRPLSQPFVFVGGVTVELYGDPSSAPEARPTNDVFEDIVYVLDNCPNLPERLQEGSREVIAYLQNKFTGLLLYPDIYEGMYGHLEPRFAAQKTERILATLTRYTQTR